MSSNITVSEFCLYNTSVRELIVVRDSGYIVHTVYIDHEDLFRIHPDIAGRVVKSASWGRIPMVGYNNRLQLVECRILDIE